MTRSVYETMFWKIKAILTLSVFACLITGCGPQGPQPVALSGNVTLDGKPVENATIILTPKRTGRAAAASIVRGKYSFTETDGPLPGEFDVRINPNEGEIEEIAPAEVSQANRRPRIPRVYQLPGKLTASVSQQTQGQLDFQLSSREK